MGQKAPKRFPLDRVFCVMELATTHVGLDECIEVVVSVPGREGTFRKVWPTPGGVLRQDRADDLVAWCASTASNAVLAWTGIQGVLPMA